MGHYYFKVFIKTRILLYFLPYRFVVKAYHSAYMLFNVCSVFEELNEDVSGKAQ